MKLESLLVIATNKPLKFFVWGAGVIHFVNGLLPDGRRLTTEASGQFLSDALMMLPIDIANEIREMEVDPSTGRILDYAQSMTAVELAPKQEPSIAAFGVGLVMVAFALIAALWLSSPTQGGWLDAYYHREHERAAKAPVTPVEHDGI